MLPHKSCEAFLSVAEYGSFEAAALKLCITASAVTLRIQALEKQLGQILILRERPCRVTLAGQLLLEHLQHQRLLEDHLLQQLQGKKSARAFYKINIGTNADSLATWLLPAISKTLIHEHITLNIIIDDQSKTHQLLETGLVNACISAEKMNIKGCVSHHLGCMEYMMVCTPLFYQTYFNSGVSRDTISTAPAIIFNAKDHLHEDVTLTLFGLNKQQYPYHFIPSSTSFVDAIEQHLGYGLVPTIQIETQLKAGHLIGILPNAKKNVHLYWHHWKKQSDSLTELSNSIIEYAQIWLKLNHSFDPHTPLT